MNYAPKMVTVKRIPVRWQYQLIRPSFTLLSPFLLVDGSHQIYKVTANLSLAHSCSLLFLLLTYIGRSVRHCLGIHSYIKVKLNLFQVQISPLLRRTKQQLDLISLILRMANGL